MRNLIITAILSIAAINSFSQDTINRVFPGENGKVKYTEVVKIDSVSKQILYARAKQYFVENYNSANAVIQLQDETNGEIIGKGFFEESIKYRTGAYATGKIHHTVKISVKDGRYKYEVYDIRVESLPTAFDKIQVERSIETWCDAENNMCYANNLTIDVDIKALIRNLQKHMLKPTSAEEDW